MNHTPWYRVPSSKSHTRLRIALSSLFVLVLLAATPLPSASQSLGPTFEITAPSKVAVGQPIRLSLTVKRAIDLAGYETTLLFDTTIAQFNGLQQRRNDLKRLGRDVGPLGAIERPDGVAFGLYSCPTASCVDHKTPRTKAGGRGTIKLATIEIIPEQPGVLEFRVGATKFVDSMGNPLQVKLSQDRIVINVQGTGATRPSTVPTSPWSLRAARTSAAGPFDLTGDGMVTHADAMEVAVEWMLAREQGTPCTEVDPRIDINRDGCIDVADLQQLVAQYTLNDTSSRVAPARSHPDGQTETLGALSSTSATRSFTVNTTADTSDANRGDGLCATITKECSLRAAIEEANAMSGPDTILFNLSGTGVQTIALGSRLPIINDVTGPTMIDGYSQPDSTPNTDSTASNAQIRVHIQGQGEQAFDGLFITSPDNVIQGLAWSQLIRALRLYGSGATNNRLVGNFVGTDPTAQYYATATVVGASGVHIQQGASHNWVGGTTLADRNVISGNGQHGVAAYDEATDSNIIVNNLVGLSPGADRRVPNRSHGIDINTHSSYTQIGGTAQGERNVVSGNGYEGIEISHGRGTVGNQVLGNFVGTDVTGTRALSHTANGGYGVHVEDGVQNTVVAYNTIGNNAKSGIQINGYYTSGTHVHSNRIGVSLDDTAIRNLVSGIRITFHAQRSRIGPNNQIASNPIGIEITGDTDNDYHTITRNSIYGNTGLGIDLAPLGGINPNDAGDADSGPNDQLNFPVLTSATTAQVQGTACASCTIEIFQADDGAGAYGEGRTFVGTAQADSTGQFTVPISGVVSGQYVTATATDTIGNTSEFGANIGVGADTGSPVVIVSDQFNRTISNGWGSADTGGSYTVGGTAADYRVSSGMGVQRLPTAASSRVSALSGIQALNVDARVRIQTDKQAMGGNQYSYLVLRRVSSNAEYRAQLRFTPTGAVVLRAARVVGGVETLLGSDVAVGTVMHQANQLVWLRAEVTSTAPTIIRIKAWADGQSEPTGWNVSVTDNTAELQQAGAVGVRAYLQGSVTNAPVNVSFDDLNITKSE